MFTKFHFRLTHKATKHTYYCYCNSGTMILTNVCLLINNGKFVNPLAAKLVPTQPCDWTVERLALEGPKSASYSLRRFDPMSLNTAFVPKSPETRAKIAKTKTGSTHPPETCAKIGLKRKAAWARYKSSLPPPPPPPPPDPNKKVHGRTGCKHTPDACAMIALKNKEAWKRKRQALIDSLVYTCPNGIPQLSMPS